MQKIFLYISILFFISTSIYSQNQVYKIKGNINEQNDGSKVYLAKLNSTKTGLQNIDSTFVEKGHFNFTDNLPDSIDIRFVRIIESKYDEPILLIPEKGLVTINFEKEVPIISGTKRNDELQLFLTEQINSKNKIQEIIDSNTDQVSELKANNLNKSIELLYQDIAKARYNYSSENIKNNLGEFVFLTSLEVIPPDSILNLLSNTRASFKDSPLGIDLKNYYSPLIAKMPGQKYTDIELKNIEGKTVKLSNYLDKNQVVLIDFWASWCGPCVREMPELVEIYNDYKNKGFQIVGVSFDDTQSSWMRAVERLKMTWPQLSDLKGWESIAGKVYGIKAIPFTLLIGKDGKIIGSNIKGDELRSTLNKLLNVK